MSSSVGMMTFPTEWKKNMFQTSNHIYIYVYIYIHICIYAAWSKYIQIKTCFCYDHPIIILDFCGISWAFPWPLRDRSGQVHWVHWAFRTPQGGMDDGSDKSKGFRAVGTVGTASPRPGARHQRWQAGKSPIYITGYSWNKDIFIYPEGSYIYILSHYYHYIYIHSGYLT
jgi:hypothetical protein